ncbi:MAG: DUF4333 domain-containing protein [Deltaproteobacteria bacterium]|nr:DUF4333 domain-containing protein [Deltaproteobacteria bacterium]
MRKLSLPFVLVVFVGCQAQVSCGKNKNLDMTKGREFVSSKLERDVGQKPTAVTCPETVKPEKGATFECTATFGKANATVKLVQDDDKGGVTITAVTGILIAARLEKQIADGLGKKHNVHLEVACGERIRQSVKGDRFHCDAKDAKGQSAKIAVEVENDDGKVVYKVEPQQGASPVTPEAPEPVAPN